MSTGRKGLTDDAEGTCTDLHPRAKPGPESGQGSFPPVLLGTPMHSAALSKGQGNRPWPPWC